MFADVFRGKKVVVTGNTGFKGSWLSAWLQSLGAEVHGISDAVHTSPSVFEALGLRSSVHYHELDIRDLGALSSTLHDIRPDLVLHLAAQALVFDAYDDPITTLTTNAIGTANVLESLRKGDFPCTAVMITSDKCYENVEWVWGYRETDALGGSDPYSASKACAEHVIRTYYKSFFSKPDSHVRVASTRAGNVIGGGDWSPNRIVPDCIKAWTESKAVEIRRPNATRPWQHVLEPLSGYLCLAQRLLEDPSFSGESFNFGPNANQDHSVLELIETLTGHWFKDGQEFEAVNIHPDTSRPEAGLLKLTCDKALAALSWQPTLEFESTCELTADWYRNYYRDPSSALECTQAQIQSYVSRATERKLAWTAG